MNLTNTLIVALAIAHGGLVWSLERHRRDINNNLRRINRRIKLADPIKGK